MSLIGSTMKPYIPNGSQNVDWLKINYADMGKQFPIVWVPGQT